MTQVQPFFGGSYINSGSKPRPARARLGVSEFSARSTLCLGVGDEEGVNGVEVPDSLGLESWGGGRNVTVVSFIFGPVF